MSVSDLADLTVWLPAGSAMWRSMGGPAAWSQETTMSAAIEHSIRAFNWGFTEDAKQRRNYPDAITPPEFYQEVKEAQRVLERRVEKFKRRHMARPTEEVSDG